MGTESFAKAFLSALKTPDIQSAIKAIVGEQMREDLHAELGTLRKEVKQLRSRVADLEEEVENLEQYSRRNCLRISGVPESDNEDAAMKTLELFNEKMKLTPPIQPTDVDRIHRLGKKNEGPNARPRGIIVKFATYGVRNRVMLARRSLRTDSTSMENAVYINESLTRQRSTLMYKARMMKRKKMLQDVWSHDGNIVIKDNQGRIRSGKTCAEIEKMISSLPLPTSEVYASGTSFVDNASSR